MDVSIRREKPDSSIGVRLSLVQTFLSVLFLALIQVVPSTAVGYTVHRVNFGANVRLRTGDIVHNGSPLGNNAEQVFDQGTLSAELTDFSQPVDVGITAGAGTSGTLTASIDRSMAIMIRLSRAERGACIGPQNFEITLDINSPSPGAIGSAAPGGGAIQVTRFEPIYRGGRGNRCPSNLFYGYQMDLELEGALADGAYQATADIAVSFNGEPPQIVQAPLEVRMPSVLLLYHRGQINVNLNASALAGAFGASSACSGDFCMDLGGRTVSLSNSNGIVPVGIAGPGFNPLQTINLRDAIGVRGIGCVGGIYGTATYEILSAVGGIQTDSGNLSGIQNAPCGMALRTGDLPIDLDLTQFDSASGRASATIQVTVTGL
jgi:hypothetical protein